MRTTDGHREARFLSSNIGYLAEILGLSNADLARIMGISSALFYQRKAKPWTFRIGELEKIADYAGRHGMTVSAAQLLIPFCPAVVRETEDLA